jgi:ubiquinone/menaquinone biosynthesis C-methylase UbiE
MNNLLPSAKYFDKIAAIYDQATAPANAWTPPKIVAQYVQSYVSQSTKLLDIGMGTGKSLHEISLICPSLYISKRKRDRHCFIK